MADAALFEPFRYTSGFRATWTPFCFQQKICGPNVCKKFYRSLVGAWLEVKVRRADHVWSAVESFSAPVTFEEDLINVALRHHLGKAAFAFSLSLLVSLPSRLLGVLIDCH